MLEDYLKENNLIITSNKLDVIRKINNIDRLIQYKVMTKKEFLDNYYFSYDKKTIKYLVEEYNLSVENALEYLNTLIYLNDNDFGSIKLANLIKIRKELFDKELLYTNPLFRNSLTNTNIIVYDCWIEPFFKNILDNYKYEMVKSNVDAKKINLYEFNSINDEIGYVCYDIKKKLDSGIDINRIKIVSTNEYENALKRIFNLSLIPLDYPNKIALYDLPIGKRIIKLIDTGKTLEEVVNTISDIDDNLYSKVISVLNDYVEIGINKNMIKYDLKNTFITDKHINNAVRVIDINDVDFDDITYLVGFNKENYPRVYKDEEILSDNIKIKLGLFTSTDNNKNEKEKLLNIIYKNNFIITYKLKDSFNNYNKPLLFNEENSNIISNPKIEYNFSNIYNKEKLTMEYDNFYKYGTISDSLILLKENYKDLDYNTYDNKFTGIDKDTYLKNIDKLSLAYSSIDNYFRCGFRYYLSNVLKISDTNSDDFYINIGNIFHYVLSKYRDSDFDFQKCWDQEANKYEFTLDKLIFLENLKQELKYDIEIIKKQENYSSMHDYLFEKRLNVNIENDLGKEIRFTGVVDKIIYTKDNDKTYVSIVDYKTGTLHTDINNMIYGIGMQLPIYLYLVRRNNLFPNSIIVGFYLQKIINKDMKETINKRIDDLKEEALRLVGYSNYDGDTISRFDSTYKDSSLIHGLKTKNDGSFYSYSKVLNDNELDKIEEIVSNKIKDGVRDILNTKFDINPKKIDKDNVGCMYCPFKDICFMKEEDIKELAKQDIFDYLGGDTNA